MMTHIEQNYKVKEDLSEAIRIIEDLVKIDDDRVFNSSPCRMARALMLISITVPLSEKRLIKRIYKITRTLSAASNCLEEAIKQHELELEKFRISFQQIHGLITENILPFAIKSLQERPDVLTPLASACDITEEAFKKVSSTEELSKYALMLAQINAEAFLLLLPDLNNNIVQQVLTIERLLDERAMKISI